MIGNAIIQAGIVSYYKSVSAITDLVTPEEIREAFWKGTQFIYPNIRIRLNPSVPSPEGCGYENIDFVVVVNSEQASSYESLNISTVCATNTTRSFEYSVGGVTYLFSGIHPVSMGNALAITQQLWQVNNQFQGIISVAG